MIVGQYFVFLVFEIENNRRKIPSEDVYAENLEKYKCDNQSLLLQVSKLVFINSENQINVVLLILICRYFSQFIKVLSVCVQVEALQAQLQEQTRLSKEQVESLLDDRNIKSQEAQAQRLHDQKQIESLTDK